MVSTAQAVAEDGALEINQVCATQTGCFPGDSAGFPVTISSSGHYRLTSNLTLLNANTDGIAFGSASVSHVSIDLRGFEIRGPVVCSGAPLACTPSSGTGSGIERLAASNVGISVRDGSITGMGAFGAWLGDQAEATGLRVRSNAGTGIEVGIGSVVEANLVAQNGQSGISANGARGATVSGNVIYGNRTSGIAMTGTDSIAIGNSVYGNGQTGIAVIGRGISVQGNTIRLNSGAALDFGIGAGDNGIYRDNTITANTLGTVTTTGGTTTANMGGNSCNGTSTCP